MEHEQSNVLLLNPNKTKAMFIYRSRATVSMPCVVVAGVTIPYSSKVCDLGMTLNDRLKFDDHINDFCSRVYYISSELKLRLVKVLVIPQFLFGVSCFKWLIPLVCANLRSFSIIVYGLFMACSVRIASLNTIPGVGIRTQNLWASSTYS
jgi:hypothetical protein